MQDSQNSKQGKSQPSPANEAESPGDKDESRPKSYYYDDSTGYETYDEEEHDSQRIVSRNAEGFIQTAHDSGFGALSAVV